jgi:hypothetical protein
VQKYRVGSCRDVVSFIVVSSETRLNAVAESPNNDLEAFLATMRLAISKLDETVRSRPRADVPGSIVGLCRPVLQIYRCCRDFDRSFGTSFFTDDVLMTIISDIRTELRKDRTAFMNKQVSAACCVLVSFHKVHL